MKLGKKWRAVISRTMNRKMGKMVVKALAEGKVRSRVSSLCAKIPGCQHRTKAWNSENPQNRKDQCPEQAKMELVPAWLPAQLFPGGSCTIEVFISQSRVPSPFDCKENLVNMT